MTLGRVCIALLAAAALAISGVYTPATLSAHTRGVPVEAVDVCDLQHMVARIVASHQDSEQAAGEVPTVLDWQRVLDEAAHGRRSDKCNK